jgi:hypothetical protein
MADYSSDLGSRIVQVALDSLSLASVANAPGFFLDYFGNCYSLSEMKVPKFPPDLVVVRNGARDRPPYQIARM